MVNEGLDDSVKDNPPKEEEVQQKGKRLREA
jgi:hypothetical protein